MGEMEDKLQQLLSSEDGMKRVMSLASALMSGQGLNASGGKATETAQTSTKPETEDKTPDMASLQNTISKIMDQNKKGISSDSKLNLLTALKPFLDSGRQSSIDRAARVMKTAKVAKTALDEFKGGK